MYCTGHGVKDLDCATALPEAANFCSRFPQGSTDVATVVKACGKPFTPAKIFNHADSTFTRLKPKHLAHSIAYGTFK